MDRLSASGQSGHGNGAMEFNPDNTRLVSGDGLFQQANVSDYLGTLERIGTQPDHPLAIYLHIPYSPLGDVKNDSSLASGQYERSVSEYLNLLELELHAVTQRIGTGRRLQQVHLGGNAPNAMSERHLVRLAEMLDQYLNIDQDTDASINADGRMVTCANLDLLNGLGFNQIVFSVQDLHPDVQSAMGKVQSANLVGDVYQACREAGFEFITSDLGYGLPNQSRQSIEHTLQQYLAVQPDRIMCRGFDSAEYAAGRLKLPGDLALPSLAEKMVIFNTIVETLESSGYQWIGIDCFAKPTDPICTARENRQLGRNRIGYGARAPEDVIGIGSHAYSDVDGYVACNHSSTERYSETLNKGEVPVAQAMHCNDTAQQWRRLLTRLACNRSTELDSDQIELIDKESAPGGVVSKYLGNGMVRRSESGLEIDPEACFAMNSLWKDLIPAPAAH